MTHHREPDPILLTGASGYVGSPPARRAAAPRPRRPRARARPATARASRRRRRPPGRRRQRRRASPRRSTAAAPPTTSSTRWAAAGDDFAARDREAAVNFGEAARDGRRRARRSTSAGSRATGADASEHLRSRHEVAELLRQRVPRARLRARGDDHRRGQRLVRDAAPPRRPPAGDDHAALGRHAHAAGRDRRRRRGRSPTLAERDDAPARGPARRRRRPDLPRDDAPLRGASPAAARRCIVTVPVLTPRLSSYWVALVTPVELGARAAAGRRA